MNKIQQIETVAKMMHEMGVKMHTFANIEPNTADVKEWEHLSKIDRMKYRLVADAVINHLLYSETK